VGLAALPEQMIRPLALALASLILWYLLGKYLNAAHVMGLHLGTLILTFIIGGIWLSRALPKEIFEAAPAYETRTWIVVSIPLMCMTAVTYLFGRIGLLMTGGMLGSAEAGIFSAASQIALTLTFGVRSANMIAAPMISELYTTDRMDKLQEVLRVAVLGLIGFTVPLCLGLILLGKWILGFFGQDFVEGYAALVILAAGQTFNALSGSTGFMMTMTKGQNQAAYIMVLTLLVTIGLCFVLIPHWGIVGAAIGVAFGHVLRNVLMLVYVRRKLKVDPSVLCLLRGRVMSSAS
jgi:O-antigen/teichoic acid export membrane protein